MCVRMASGTRSASVLCETRDVRWVGDRHEALARELRSELALVIMHERRVRHNEEPGARWCAEHLDHRSRACGQAHLRTSMRHDERRGADPRREGRRIAK